MLILMLICCKRKILFVAEVVQTNRARRERDLVRRLKGGSHGNNRTAALTTEVLDIPLRGAGGSWPYVFDNEPR